jgi:23S rRNA (pseudouridine1915-N3)-methyltransferase
MVVKVLWMGRTRNPSLEALVADYEDRIRRLIPLQIIELPDLSRKQGLRGKDLKEAEGRKIRESLSARGRLVALDEGGTEFTSGDFARWFQSEENRSTQAIQFVVGGPEGLSDEVLARANLKLSLGIMTWTHEMCRALLMEQIYRAQCILRNIPYHR